MATLLIKESSERSLMRLPHLIELNGQTIGVLGAVGKDAYKEMLRPNLPPRIARIALPAGHYTLCIRSLFRWFYATAELQVEEGRQTIVTFADKEKYWDWVFWIDMAAWLLKLILHLGRPWSIIYEIVSDGLLLVWLIHEIAIRKTYFKIQVEKNEASGFSNLPMA